MKQPGNWPVWRLEDNTSMWHAMFESVSNRTVCDTDARDGHWTTQWKSKVRLRPVPITSDEMGQCTKCMDRLEGMILTEVLKEWDTPQTSTEASRSNPHLQVNKRSTSTVSLARDE